MSLCSERSGLTGLMGTILKTKYVSIEQHSVEHILLLKPTRPTVVHCSLDNAWFLILNNRDAVCAQFTVDPNHVFLEGFLFSWLLLDKG